MLPQQVLSSRAIPARFLQPKNRPFSYLTSYERGGIALLDGSQGVNLKNWRGRYIGNDIVLDADDVAPTVVLTHAGITEFEFTFDQSMNPFISFMENDTDAKFYWFDTTLPGFTITTLPVGSVSPRCALDDHRDLEASVSDIILVYLRSGNLYFRAQRDRYLIEYLLQAGLGATKLGQVGMNRVMRFQIGAPGFPTHTFNFSW